MEEENKERIQAREQSVLSKEEKGRFKKLRKRLQNVASHMNVSGLIAIEDCYEWQELSRRACILDAPVATPQLFWRRGCVRGRSTEGSHHRDILFSLLLQPAKAGTTEGKSQDETSTVTIGQKRVRPMNPPSKNAGLNYRTLPPWLNFHNPASVKCIGVVELHCSSDDLLQSMSRKIKEQLSSSDDRSYLVAPTRWFSSRQPKCISDALMFSTPITPIQTPRKSTRISPETKSLANLIGEMRKLVLSRDEMAKANYPVLGEIDDDWISTPRQSTSESPSGKMFALDCEMVDSTAGRALARFSLVEAVAYNTARSEVVSQVMLDTLVLPLHRITNYLTPYSGITASLLEQGPTMSLKEVQAYITAHVTEHDILIGHSLENDLRVCQWAHSCCVDTALLFSPHHKRSFKYSLRHLSRVLLKRDIQQSNKPHCSEEDAKAAMDLAVGRVLKGVDFALKDTRSTNQWGLLSCNKEGKSAVGIGPSTWLQKYIIAQPNGAHALSCEKCTDPSSKALLAFISSSSKRRSRLTWAQFLVSNKKEEESCGQLIQELLNLMSSTDTAVLVALQSRFHHVDQECQRRDVLRDPKSTLSWTDTDEQALEECIDTSCLGYAIWVGGARLSSNS